MISDELPKGERTSQAIIEAAYTLFIEQGYHGTSMRQIAQRSGLALGGIYNHFNSKEEIFDRVLLEKHPYKQVLGILQSAPGDTLETFARNAASTMTAELGKRPDFLKLVLIEVTEFKGRHAPLLFQTIFPQVLPLLARFQESQNELRDLPLPTILLSFLGIFLSYFLAKNMIEPTGALDLGESALEQYMDIFLHGVLKP